MDEIKIKIVYFAYLVPDAWFGIVTEQLDNLQNLKLYENASNIYISVIADDIEFGKLKELIKSKYQKLEIINHYHENVYEYPGIKAIYDLADANDDNTILLYFHSKGMTSHAHHQRIILFNKTIKPYEEIITEFQNNKDLDISCILPHPAGFAYFNFFWVRSSYVKKYLCEPIITTDRFYWEVWLGNPFSTKEKIITYSPILKYDTIVIQ